MTNEQKALLELISSSINNRSISPLKFLGISWEELFKEAKMQAVALMSFDLLSDLKDEIPKEVYREWLKYVGAILKANNKVLQGQKEVTELLELHNYPYIIIKGEASSSYYSCPSKRTLGDVDFLVSPNDFNDIKRLLSNNGFSVEQENHICHITYLKGGVEYEMHFEVAGIPDGVLGELVRDFFSDAINDFEIKSNNIQNYRAPTDINHALIILLHTQHHFVSEGIGLRHLCDWASLVSKTHKLDFWENALLPFLKKIGLFDFAMAITKTACRYLEIEEPLWLTEIDELIIEEIMQDIFSGGNFGNKDNLKAKSGIFISNHGKEGTKHSKFYNVCNAVKNAIYNKHPSSKRFPILLLFFFPYSIIRQLILILFKKRTNILKAIPLANKRKELYDKLNIFEVEN